MKNKLKIECRADLRVPKSQRVLKSLPEIKFPM